MLPFVKILLKFVALVIVPISIGVLVFLQLRAYFLLPLDPNSTTPVLIEANWKEKDFTDLCAELEDREVLHSCLALQIIFKLRPGVIKQGEYKLQANMAPLEIANILRSGEIYLRELNIPAGASLYDVAQSFADSGLLTAEEFLAAATDKQNLLKTGIRADSFEGYLFPGDYQFSKTNSAYFMLRTIADRGDTAWEKENFSELAKNLGYSRFEITTLASLIERESGNKADLSTVSSVYHNRLKTGMRLQSTKALRYGLLQDKAELVKQDLQSAHPYNTFINYGLPPGPIGNPGITAIRAALQPQETDYLFFITLDDGQMKFFTTQQDYHQALEERIEQLRDNPTETP